jgi:hypothetical protein
VGGEGLEGTKLRTLISWSIAKPFYATFAVIKTIVGSAGNLFWGLHAPVDQRNC